MWAGYGFGYVIVVGRVWWHMQCVAFPDLYASATVHPNTLCVVPSYKPMSPILNALCGLEAFLVSFVYDTTGTVSFL